MKHFRLLLVLLVLTTLGARPAAAQMAPADIQQLVAPIALYPDSLLSNMLVAATYPDEVSAAAQFVAANGPLQPAQVFGALGSYDWVPEVKSLTAFPDAINMLANNMDWTVTLGNVYLSQPQDIFGAIQNLRMAAQSDGALASNAQEIVSDDDGSVVIEPANPDDMSVPYYDPNYIYTQGPSAGYYLSWGAPVVIGNYLWLGVPDWRFHRLYTGMGYNYYYGGRHRNEQWWGQIHNQVQNHQGLWHLSPTARHMPVPAASQINLARGWGNMRITTRPGARPVSVTPSRFAVPSRTFTRPVTRPQAIRTAPPARPAVTHVAPMNIHPAPVHTVAPVMAPVQNVPHGFNVRPGFDANAEAARGAASRNQQRPTPVHPFNYTPPPSRPAPAARPAPPPRPAAAPVQHFSRPAPAPAQNNKKEQHH